MASLLPWYWRPLPLNQRTGAQVFEQLFYRPGAIGTLLESPARASDPNLARYSICAGPPRTIGGKLQLWTPPLGQILPFLRRLLERQGQGGYPLQDLPFTGGWLGWLGYDLAWEIETLPWLKADPLPFPVAYWYEPASFALIDGAEQVLWLAATGPEDLDRLQERLESGLGNPLPESNGPASASLEVAFLSSQAEYETAVRQAQKYIRAGDIFQANLSLRFQAATRASSWAIYRALTEINPSPFASFWQSPWGSAVSCSPERLIQLQGREAQTRPIAGTRPRGGTPEREGQLVRELAVDPKERAEHVMLVDLERNDLGRVCESGSVQVDELLAVERYSHVMHLVSNVRGTLRSGCDAADLIAAVFPGGTITGCPKVRCMKVIEELEPFRRNLFYGSCGYLDRRGNLDLNILIRTLLLSPPPGSPGPTTAWGQVGAGIVADSDPEREWHESLHKAQAQLAALRLAGWEGSYSATR